MSNFNSEKEFVDKVELLLKECGFETWREVIPDQHEYKEFPFRVDLIFFKQGLGYFALEAKNFRTIRQGSAFAKAIEQINKYRNLTFFKGMKINKWLLASPYEIPSITTKDIEERVISEVKVFIKHFINYMYDISLLEFIEYDNHIWDRISIDSGSKDRAIHINKSEVKRNGISFPKV